MSAEVRRQKADIGRQRERSNAKQAREVLRNLRARIAARRADKRARIVAVRDMCREKRAALRAAIKQWRVELAELIRTERARVCAECGMSRAQARTAGDAEILDAVKAYAAERGHQASLKREPGKPSRVVVKERRAESDDEVRNNLDRDLLPVWEVMKKRIKAGPRSSRTEAFLQWAHDHAGEAQRILAEHHEAESEREYREMIAQEKKLTKGMRARRVRAADLEAIPF